MPYLRFVELNASRSAGKEWLRRIGSGYGATSAQIGNYDMTKPSFVVRSDCCLLKAGALTSLT